MQSSPGWVLPIIGLFGAGDKRPGMNHAANQALALTGGWFCCKQTVNGITMRAGSLEKLPAMSGDLFRCEHAQVFPGFRTIGIGGFRKCLEDVNFFIRADWQFAAENITVVELNDGTEIVTPEVQDDLLTMFPVYEKHACLEIF